MTHPEKLENVNTLQGLISQQGNTDFFKQRQCNENTQNLVIAMSNPELTKAELVSMTGYTQPTKQIEWLESNHIHYAVKGGGMAGNLCVLRAWAENAPLYSNSTSRVTTSKPNRGMNLSKVKSR